MRFVVRIRSVSLVPVIALALLCIVAVPAAASAGDLDSAFGAGGRIATDLGSGADRGEALIVQPDGKLVVAGGVGEAAFALTRYNPDGSLDAGFGGGGRLTTAVGGHIQIAFALAVQLDGKLVAAGNSGDDFAVVRYNPDGSLDKLFWLSWQGCHRLWRIWWRSRDRDPG